MLPAVVLALLGGLPPLHLDMLEGRADLATATGVVPLRPAQRLPEQNGPGYLESGALSRLRLRWSGAASVELRGASALEWRAAEREEHGISLEVLRLDELSAEVRRGPLRLELPGGWRLTLSHGTVFVRTLPEGALEVEHGAGAPLLLARVAEGEGAQPPWTVLAGARVRLPEGQSEPKSASGREPTRLVPGPLSGARAAFVRLHGEGARPAGPAAPWSGFSWPWTAPADSEAEPVSPSTLPAGPRKPGRRRLEAWGPGWRQRVP